MYVGLCLLTKRGQPDKPRTMEKKPITVCKMNRLDMIKDGINIYDLPPNTIGELGSDEFPCRIHSLDMSNADFDAPEIHVEYQPKRKATREPLKIGSYKQKRKK